MPIYEVRDNQTGKTISFKWHGKEPPTEADLQEISAASRTASGPTAVPSRPSLGLPYGIPLGEIDASMLPEKPVRGMLPVGASLLGLGVGSLGGPTTAYLGNVAGAMGGSALEDYLYGTPTEDMAKRALESGILAGIAPVGGVAVERMAAPGAKYVTQEARAALEYARKNNLPIDVSELSPSWVTQLFSGDIFAAGRYKTKRYARDAREYLIGIRSKVLEDLTGAPETTKIPIGAVPGKVRPELKAKTKEAYEEPIRIVQEVFGDADALVRLENTRRTAGELLRDPRIQNAKKAKRAPSSPKEWLEDFLRESEKGKEGGNLPFSRLHKLQGEINRTFYGATNEGGAPLLASLADDLVKWDVEVGKRLNDSYTIARKAAKDEFLFDTVYGVLRSATEIDKETGAEILNGLRLRAKLQTPIKKAGWRTAEQEIIEKLGKEEGRKTIDDLYAVSDYAQHTMKLRKKESMPVFDPTTLLSGGGAPALAGLKVGVAVPQGTSLALTIMLTGPGRKGFLRNFLMAPGHPTLKLGTRFGIQYGGEQLK